MLEFPENNKFILRHPVDFLDPHCYEYKIYDFETGELLLESRERKKELKKLKDFAGSLLNVSIFAENGKEVIRIERRLSLSIPFFSIGHYKYIVHNENDQIIGTFKPGRFIRGGRNLTVLSHKKSILRVRRKLFGTE